MRKYVEVAKILFKAQLAFRFDVAMTALETLGRVLFAWLIWGAVFIGRDTVGGFTLQAMILYYVVSSFLASLDLSWGVSGEVSERIRGGTFSKFMVIPSNPQLHFLAQTMGTTAFYALFALPVAIFSGFLFGADTLVLSPIPIFIGVIMIPLGMIFITSYHFFIGLLAFKFQDVSFFRHLQGSIIQFAQGAMVPLILLPVFVLNILNVLPFPHMIFTPTMLITGNMGTEEGLYSLGVLALWTIVMLVVSQITYNRLRIKFDGVGV